MLSLAYAAAASFYRAPRWRIACFAGGIALIVAAFVTPLETLALHYLLTAHLLQNVVLAEWAPALVVLGLPPALAAEAARSATLRVLTYPLVALPLWIVNYFVWHLPWIYDAALGRPETLLHLEHAGYLLTGVLFWWPIVHDRPHAVPTGAKAAYLFGAFVLASPLGLLLTLVQRPLYDFYEHAPRVWGLSPLGDRQLGGATMAGEQALVLFALFAIFFGRFLAEQDLAEEAPASGRRQSVQPP